MPPILNPQLLVLCWQHICRRPKYNRNALTPETAAPRPEALDYVFWWLSPILLLVVGGFCWVDHFDAGFHRDDFPNIVNNRHIRNGDTGELLTSPRAFSQDTEHADFRPLLALLFEADYTVRRDGLPAVFQLSSFLWFLPLPFLIYALVRAIPESRHETAIFSAALFAVHPLVADTLNYVSRRGELIAAGSVTMALIIWVVWPEHLPSSLGLDLHRIPKTFWQGIVFRHGAQIERLYRKVLRAPAGLYFLPLLVGLLCSPAAAAFAFIAAAWIWVFPPTGRTARAGWRRVVPGAAVCLGWLVLHASLTWSYLSPLRVPALQYWLGQPRVAVQYFIWFFTPFNLSADAGLLPELRLWPPDILIGIAGVAALVALAVFTRKKDGWRGVSFGIAWFLAAQIPFALVPQATVDSGARMFIPSIGLAIAVGQVLMSLALRAQTLPRHNVAAAFLSSSVLFMLLGSMVWLSYHRNAIWKDDLTLWSDTVRRSPHNQRALIQYAWELIRHDDVTVAREFVERADKAPPQDARSEVLVAEALDRMGLDAQAEVHYKRATTTWPRYAAAMSSFGNWLMVHQRTAEAADWSQRALRLNYFDNQARRNLMDVHSAGFEWQDVTRLAKEALAIEPDDARARLALVTSQDALDRVGRAEHTLAGTANFNDYLTLSVAYYRAKRYDDCIIATKEALKLQPALAEAESNMAACYHALGRDDEAITALRDVVRLRPDFDMAWTNLRILERDKLEKRTKLK